MARKNEAVSHALQIRESAQLDNYHQFFRLYKATPNMGTYILDKIVDTYRLHALTKMRRGYQPTLPMLFVLEELAFDTRKEDRQIGIDFLKKAGCKIKDENEENSEWNTKDSVISYDAVINDAKLL